MYSSFLRNNARANYAPSVIILTDITSQKMNAIVPKKNSKSRIKRLRGMSRPGYRLRVEDIRMFYDVKEADVEILAIIPKPQASEWLDRHGEKL